MSPDLIQILISVPLWFGVQVASVFCETVNKACTAAIKISQEFLISLRENKIKILRFHRS